MKAVSDSIWRTIVQANENKGRIAKNARGKKKGKKFAERKCVLDPGDAYFVSQV